MTIQESGEMYLETILLLSRKNGKVRSVDVSSEMNYSKPSVSRAMGILRRNGYIETDSCGYIVLTERGLDTALKIYEKHMLLTKWLISVGVDAETAAEDACRIEHVISDRSFDAIRNHIETVRQ